MANILITGVGSGLGEALVDAYLQNGDTVHAIGQKLLPKFDHHLHFFFFPYDMSETFMLQSTLTEFLSQRSFDIVILNAGVLGEIQTLSNTDLSDIQKVMDVNVWANKELIDTLSKHAQFVGQIIGISSGAAVNGSKGWGAYSLSKSALNMLLNVYAKELPNIHFTALAPGIIKTPMTDHIIKEVNDQDFPLCKNVKRKPYPNGS
ncbi:MAG: SDR family NAD(P)-dependent oxidoreductase [Sulfurovum sp.]|nr:SDR family NAD(P)-dependent oxidoreductase [Sulfurovum sp.]